MKYEYARAEISLGNQNDKIVVKYFESLIWRDARDFIGRVTMRTGLRGLKWRVGCVVDGRVVSNSRDVTCSRSGERCAFKIIPCMGGGRRQRYYCFPHVIDFGWNCRDSSNR